MKNKSNAESSKITSNYGRCKNLKEIRASLAQITALRAYPSIKLCVAIKVLEYSFNYILENRRKERKDNVSHPLRKKNKKTGTGTVNHFHPHKLKILRV
jgi:hypothetical protein